MDATDYATLNQARKVCAGQLSLQAIAEGLLTILGINQTQEAV